MMDTTQIPSGPDAYEQYLNSGQITPPPQTLAPMPPINTPVPSAASAQPTFADMVSQREAANGGKPLAEADLDALSQNTWAQEEPLYRASRKGLKEGDIKAEKAAYDNQYQQFKANYLKKNAAAAPAADPWYMSLGKAALGGAEQGIGEGVRYVGGGLATLGDAVNNNLIPGTPQSSMADAYFRATDPTINAMTAQGKQLQEQAETAHPVAAFAGQLPGAIASAGVLPTMSAVGNERESGGSVAQQEGILGINTAANLAGLGLGGIATRSVGRRLGAQLLGNTAIGVGQNVGSSVVDAKNNPVSAGGTAAQIALSVALSELGARIHLRSEAKTAAAKTEADKLVAQSQAKVAAAQQQQTAPGNPINTPAGTQSPAGGGPGIPDAQHASVVSEAQQQAQDPSAVKAFDAAVAKNPLLKEPAARAQEVVNHASAIAEMSAQDSGADWASMSPMQQHEATEAAAQVLAKTTDTPGVPELLQAQRQQLNAAPPASAAPVQETGQPDIQGQTAAVPGETPQAAPQGESGTPVAEVPGQESGMPGVPTPAEETPTPSPIDSSVDAELAQFGYKPEELANLKTLGKVRLLTRLKRSENGPRRGLATPVTPEAAQGLASDAMAGTQSSSPVDNTPKDPLDQTSAQAGTIINRQLHDTLDNALGEIRGKLNRKTYPPAKLAKMTLEEKHNAYVKETAPTPSTTKSEAVSGDVQAATAKVPAPGINQVNDLGQPRQPGEPLSIKTPVVTTKDVHLAGGVSQDGNTIYIDQRMPKFVSVDGKRINVHEAVALHERVEWPLMKEMGAVYHDAHDAATAAENHFIRQKYGVDPLKYQDALKAAIKKAGIENRHPSADIPADLDSQPNVDLGDTAPLEGKVSPLSRKGIGAKKAQAPVEAQPLEPTASSVADRTTFKTAKGSTYVDHGDGTTSRNKAYRPEHGTAEQGPMPRSQRTVYIDEADLGKLGEFQTQGESKALMLDEKTKHAGIKYLSGKDAGKIERRTVTSFHADPAIGRVPVELWNDGKTVHFGNKITEVAKGSMDAVESLLEGKVTPADLADVRSMVERAQNGMPEDLHARINEMRSDDTITPEEAKALRQAGREAPRNAAERDIPTTEAADAGHEDLLDIQRDKAPTTELGNAAEEVARAADEVPTSLKSDRARAAETIAKLRKLFPDSPNHQKGIDFLAWVLGKNPALIRTIKGVARTPEGVSYGGRFGSVSRILELVDRKDMASNTAVHELMHAAESLLPQPIRDAVLKAREAEINRLAPSAAPAEKAMFEYLQNSLKASSSEERALYMQGAKDELLQLRDNKTITGKRIGELYSLVNSSEYWAVHATDMLQEGYLRKGLWAQAHQWLKGFIEQIHSLFSSNPNRDAIINGLQHIMGTQETGTQSFLRDYEMTKTRYAGQPEGLTPVMEAEQLHNFILDKGAVDEDRMERTRTKVSRFREVVAASHAAFDNFREDLLREFGIKLATGQDLALQTRLMMGSSGKLIQDDADKFMQPIIAAFTTHWPEVAAKPEEALAKLGEYQVIRSEMLHQWPHQYRTEVPLDNGREVMRQKILQNQADRKIDAVQAEAQLKALADKHASIPFADWARQAKGIAHSDTGETQYDRRVRKLAEYAKNGTAAASRHFDPLYAALNENITKRRIEAGKVAADDQYARGHDALTWRTLAGYAGEGAEDTGPANAADLTMRAGKRMGAAINKAQLKTAEGRASLAANGLLKPFQQMETAARDVARHQMTGSVLESHYANKKALRTLARTRPDLAGKIAQHETMNTSVETFTGTPREGYTSTLTDKHYDELPSAANTVTHNDGRTHYVMTFPEDSNVYRGLRAVNTNWDPRDIPWANAIFEGVEHAVHGVTRPLGLGEPTHLITHSTNFLSQVRTIVNPLWDAATLLPRLLFEKPLMYSLQNSKGPVDFVGHMASAYANTFGGIFHAGTGDWALKMILHDRDGLRALAKANPDSMAGWMARMNDAGASTAFTQELTMHESKNALVRAVRQGKQNPLIRGGRAVLHYEQGIADIAENLPSIGIFRSLVKSGLSDRDAAALTKQAFDLQQRGTAGRALNSYHSFFRIGATATDNLMRAFRHPEGLRAVNVMGRTVHTSVDWGKLGMLGGSIAGYSFLRYFLDRAMLGEDKDGKNRMAKIMSVNPVDAVQHGFIPNGTDKPYMYPSGLGAMQMLTAPGTLLAAVTAGDISLKEAASAYGETLMRNIPLVEGPGTEQNAGLLAHLFGIGMGATMPTVAEPGLNLRENTNSFGMPIHTAYPNDQLFAADQGKRNTPEMWKEIAQGLQQHTGADFYPETLQFMAQSYMGTMPTDLMRATLGQVSREAQGLPNNALSSLGRLQYQGSEYYDSNRLYKTADELNQTRQQLHSIQLQAGAKGTPAYDNAGQQWLASNPDAQKKLVALNQLTAAQKTYQAGLKALAASKDGPERKQYVRKQLDSALRTATDAAAKAIQ